MVVVRDEVVAVQIGQVAERTELSIRTIRHYDDVGLIVPSARSVGGFRLYTEPDVQRLLLVRRMKPLEFTLEQMRELLEAVDTVDDDGAARVAREQARAVIGDYRRRAGERVEVLRTQLERAEELADRLGTLAADPA